MENRIISPFFENETFTAESYQTLLIHNPFPRSRLLHEAYIFREKSASRHYSNLFTAYLNDKRPNEGLASGRPVAWPAHVPKLILCNAFL